jgi:hypothetical protein
MAGKRPPELTNPGPSRAVASCVLHENPGSRRPFAPAAVAAAVAGWHRGWHRRWLPGWLTRWHRGGIPPSIPDPGAGAVAVAGYSPYPLLLRRPEPSPIRRTTPTATRSPQTAVRAPGGRRLAHARETRRSLFAFRVRGRVGSAETTLAAFGCPEVRKRRVPLDIRRPRAIEPRPLGQLPNAP